MNFYEDLGVRPVINAAATLTALGGSTMSNEVLAAMSAAAATHVDMVELHTKVGARLAQLTHNEAAYVTSGCGAAISLAVLACAAGGDPKAIARFPFELDAPKHVVMHRVHHMPYDRAIELVGVHIRDIGNSMQTFPWELEAACERGAAAVFYVAGSHFPQAPALPLEQVIEIAHGHRVAVIVDAAAQLPPVSNLWHFTRDLGADLALFSGGKGLRGPQASGLMVGSAPLIEAARANGSPNQRLVRAMKAGKEEICGLLSAVERYVAHNHEDDLRHYEECVASWVAALQPIAGVTATRSFPNEAGQPVPRMRVDLDPAVCRFGATELVRRLWDGEPRVAVLRGEGETIFATPDTLSDRSDEAVVRKRLASALGQE